MEMECNGTTESASRLFISNKSLLNQKFLKTKALSRKSHVYRAFIVQWFIGNTEACQRPNVSASFGLYRYRGINGSQTHLVSLL